MTENTTPPSDRSPFDPASQTAARSARRWILIVAVLAAALAAAWWFTRSRAAAAAAAGHDHAAMLADTTRRAVMLTPEAAQRIGVTYAVVTRGPLADEVRTVGLVTYDETRVKAIAPKIDGWVEQLFISFTGQPVEEGEPLLRIYSPMLVTAQEELLLAKKLVADVGAGAGDAARRAESLLASARRRLRYWDIPDEDVARVERTGEVQKTLTLRSPLRGVVVLKNVLSGQRIMAGDAVYQVADLREVWLEGEVFERDLAAMRLGQMVTAEFAAMPGQPRRGRIVFVSPTISAETRTTKIRVALPNADLVLKPGTYATIRIRGDARSNALSVPRSAVLVTGTRVLVFVKDTDGMLTPREVELGASTNERVEILRGVVAGETVVASATFLVDAESNLSSALGAMANMPGMDMGTPKPAARVKKPAAKEPPAKAPDRMPDMPEMDHSTHKKP
jgi:Cu(I)/Ag(I) efflux system membrane fusion protein